MQKLHKFKSLVFIMLITNYGCGGGSSTYSSAITPTSKIISKVEIDSSAVILSGQGFGTKITPTPYYVNDFDTGTIGQMPADQISNLTAGQQGTIQPNIVRSGSKSLEFDYCADYNTIVWSAGRRLSSGNVVSYNGQKYMVLLNIASTSTTPDLDSINYQLGTPPYHCTNGKQQGDWIRNAIDLGAGGSDKIYVSFWVYMDKGTSTSKSWQWKGPITITSASALYYDLGSPKNLNATAAFTYYWYYDNSRWGNSAASVYYYDANTLTNKHGVTLAGSPSDALSWGKWQRLEFYAQRSSAANTADGLWRGRRLERGSDTFNYTNAITHQAGNDPWRYVVLTHAIESVYDGYVDLKVYMDDVYVDTTPARVEMCDTPTWAARTHCEIQPVTAWDPNGQMITTSSNPGSFNIDQAVYVYIVDSNGAVNSNGVKFMFIPPTKKLEAAPQ